MARTTNIVTPARAGIVTLSLRDGKSARIGTAWRKLVQAQISQGDGFVTMRAQPTQTQASCPKVAIGAALLAQQAKLARRTCVDRDGSPARARWWHCSGQQRSLTPAPGCLAVGVRAKPLAANRVKAVTAEQAGAGHAALGGVGP